MMLFLDTSNSVQTSFYLLDKTFLAVHVWESNRSQQENLHKELAKFLKKYKTPLQKLNKIGVVTGPGNFSRIRTGVVTANTLAYVLGLKVVGVIKRGEEQLDFKSILKNKGQKSVEVFYDKAPNITSPKKK